MCVPINIGLILEDLVQDEVFEEPDKLQIDRIWRAVASNGICYNLFWVANSV